MKKRNKILVVALGFFLIFSFISIFELHAARWYCRDISFCPQTNEYCTGDVMGGEWCTIDCKTGEEITGHVVCEAPI